MSAFPNATPWREACAADASLAAWAGPWSICFAVASGADVTVFSLTDGRMQPEGGTPVFTLAAPAEVWAKFLQPVPPRHHQGQEPGPRLVRELDDILTADAWARERTREALKRRALETV